TGVQTCALPIFLGVSAFGDHDYGGVLGLEAALDVLDDLFDVEGTLGDEDDVGAGGHTGVQGDPPGMAAHDLHHECTVVRLCGGVQAVDRLRGDVDGRVEPERV